MKVSVQTWNMITVKFKVALYFFQINEKEAKNDPQNLLNTKIGGQKIQGLENDSLGFFSFKNEYCRINLI